MFRRSQRLVRIGRRCEETRREQVVRREGARHVRLPDGARRRFEPAIARRIGKPALGQVELQYLRAARHPHAGQDISRPRPGVPGRGLCPDPRGRASGRRGSGSPPKAPLRAAACRSRTGCCGGDTVEGDAQSAQVEPDKRAGGMLPPGGREVRISRIHERRAIGHALGRPEWGDRRGTHVRRVDVEVRADVRNSRRSGSLGGVDEQVSPVGLVRLAASQPFPWPAGLPQTQSRGGRSDL